MSWLDEEPVRGGYPSFDYLALTGLERMQAAVTGGMPYPPIHHLFGLTPTESDSESTVFTMPSSPWLQTGAGVFLPGTAGLLADAPLGSAVLAELGPGQIAVTSDLTLNHLRPVFANSGTLSARARPIDVGRRLGLAEAIIEDGQGRAIAHSTTRCFVQSFPAAEVKGIVPPEAVRYDTPDPHERPVTTGIVPKEVWATKTFIEICDLIRAGDLPRPPFSEFLGLSNPVAEEGRFESSTTASPWFSSPAGTVYGGFLTLLVDGVVSGAVNTVIPANSTFASLDLKVSFLRPVMPDSRPLHARAKVVHKGRSLVVADGEVLNADGKVVVRATSSAAVMEGRSWKRAVIDEAESP